MQNKEMNQSVYTPFVKNENGFTMISMLIALSLITMMIPLMTQTLKLAIPSSYTEELGIHQFFTFIRDDFLKTESLVVKNDQLIFTTYDKYNELVTGHIQKRGHRITRRVKGGHEVYLQNIKEISFTELEYGVEIYITTIKENVYHKKIALY